MSLKPGTKLGPYEILSLFGAGGMGEVYKAHDTRLDRIVALKTLRAHLADQPELKERFERGARGGTGEDRVVGLEPLEGISSGNGRPKRPSVTRFVFQDQLA